MRRIIIKILSILPFFAALFAPVDACGAGEKDFTVIIDAGHGGHDTGAIDNGVKEKDINLKVAKKLESIIKDKLSGTRVIMTRDNDSYLTLQQRADKANNAKGDLFISIHTNSVDLSNKNRQTVAGSSVFTLGLHKDEDNLEVARRENSVIELENNYEQRYSGFDPAKDESYIIFEMAQKRNLSQSIKFAESVEKELIAIGRQDRGVHQAGFWVLWATSMPAVLIELDFICNPESAKYLSSDRGAQELAEAIYNAVERYATSSSSLVAVKYPSKAVPKEEVLAVADPPLQRSAKSENKNTKATTDNNKNSKSSKENKNKKNSQENKNKKNNPKSTTPDKEGITKENINQSEVALVSNKKTERHHLTASNTTKNKDNSRRKRRSKNSKQLSENKDFESNIVFDSKGYSTEAAPQVQSNEPTLSKKEQKALKKQLEKEAKEKAKEEQKRRKAEKKARSSSYTAKSNKIVNYYKILVLQSEQHLRTNNEKFCGLSPVTAIKENGVYSYYYGESTTDREEIETRLAEVRKKIPDACIVTFRSTR